MRTLLASLALGLLALGVRAQEGADAATAQLPKGATVSVRVASLDRVDALAKELKDWIALLKALGAEELAMLEEKAASECLLELSGIDAGIVDRTKPIYVGFGDEGRVLVFHPPAGVTWEGKKELRGEAFAVLRGGAVVAGRSLQLQAEPRGAPTAFRADGDVVLHVYLADVLAAYRPVIEAKAAETAMGLAAMGDLSEEARGLVLPVVSAFKNGILSLESFDYAFTWTGVRLESEGFVAIQEGSGLRNLLKRAGEPGSTDLVCYLPKDAFVTFSSVLNPDWPARELKELLEKAGGTDAANALMQLMMSFGSVFEESVTGRSAGCVSMGMMGSTTALYELKPGVDAKKLFESFDPTKANETYKKIGIPVSLTFERAVAKDGGTELHRMRISSESPMLAMQAAMMEICVAAENGILFFAMSPTAEDDVRAALKRVRQGERVENHPHAEAMARLGRAHNLGFTMNVGALKPMAMMMGMFGMPADAQQAIQRIPDWMPLSTAITFPDGNLRWRGDWPVKEVMKVAEGFKKAPAKEQPPAAPDDDEEFD